MDSSAAALDERIFPTTILSSEKIIVTHMKKKHKKLMLIFQTFYYTQNIY